eukprot:CAMPEP_0197587102 /NCGR_PEP_ID=MMETSP1326-20131121/8841_1 /TAXON_ID=1155430 /ORGANISM="Genus nov. species nov., Strain RCC2288" /LENGTH=147 /DNA_ID=CAMNT_0043151793 /DNA_START=154 /DNA_END=600 /DNA_ORIENTATION=-
MDVLGGDGDGYSVARGVATLPAPERGSALPPRVTVNLAGMGRHSFTTKVKDTCGGCRGKGEARYGLVCNLCLGSGLDELQLKALLVTSATDASSSPRPSFGSEENEGSDSGGLSGVAPSPLRSSLPLIADTEKHYPTAERKAGCVLS